MFNGQRNPLYAAKTKMEAESWVAWYGPRYYSNVTLVVVQRGNEWHVYKG